MQIGNLDTEVAFQFGHAAVYIESWIRWIIATPNRNWRPPKAVAANRPIASIFQPLTEASLLQMFGHPRDGVVEFHHSILDHGYVDEPRTHSLVNQRLTRAPTMRVCVIVCFVAQHHATILQRTDDERVGIKHQLALIIGNLASKLTPAVDRNNEFYSVFLTYALVVFAETWRHMHNTSSVFSGDKVAR